jgi:hypothetical protein
MLPQSTYFLVKFGIHIEIVPTEFQVVIINLWCYMDLRNTFNRVWCIDCVYLLVSFQCLVIMLGKLLVFSEAYMSVSSSKKKLFNSKFKCRLDDEMVVSCLPVATLHTFRYWDLVAKQQWHASHRRTSVLFYKTATPKKLIFFTTVTSVVFVT